MKKVIKFVKGKRDEKKDGVGISQSQSGDLISPAQTPEDERFLGLDDDGGYVADFSGKDKSLTKLHKAAWQGSLEKVKSALKKVEIDSVDRRNRTALHFAVVRGHPNIVWFLLGNNAKTGISDDEGRTPLLKAVECGHKECMALLLERGSDLNVSDYVGNTGLHVAVAQGSLDIVSVLLKKGADPELSNNAGDYPLHIATKLENKELVDLLLNFKASVDVLDRENRTPLMLSAKAGNLVLVQSFLECGAQCTTVDSNGWTAHDYALLGGYEKVAASLKSLGKIEEEAEKNREDSTRSEGGSESKTESRIEINEQDFIVQKLKKLFRKCSGEESELSEKEKSDDVPDSPSTDVMPPYCQPPKSWELIQAGMIDEKKEGAEFKRRSITALGTLRSRRESFTESSVVASPKHTLSLNRRKSGKMNNSFAKQRFSFNEEDKLKHCNFAEDKSVKASKGKLSDLGSSERNPSASESEWEEDVCASEKVAEKEKQKTDSKMHSFGATFGTFESMCQVEEVWVRNPCLDPSMTPEGGSNPVDCEGIQKVDRFPSPPSALELGVDMARSIRFMKGISEDCPLGSAMEKNLWKKSRESYSMDGLEEKNLIEGTKQNEESKSKAWSCRGMDSGENYGKFWDRASDVSKRINEQLECYDQALRELAESTSWQKTSGPHGYHSLPSSKNKDFEENKKTNSLTRKQEIRLVESRGCVDVFASKKLETQDTANSKLKEEEFFSHEEKGRKVEKGKKREILLAMREAKNAVHDVNLLKIPFEDQTLSGSKPPNSNLDSKTNLDVSTATDLRNFSTVRNPERDSEERRKSSGSSTGEEPTLWLQEDLRRKTKTTLQVHDSAEDVSEISDERGPSFSPLGVVYREIQEESQDKDKTGSGRSQRTTRDSCTWDRSTETNALTPLTNEEEEVVREPSPDVSLSSGPIEPLGAERDSGSEPESSHNDLTPPRNYSLKTQHEWLKSHLKTATSEKSQLEQVTARLSEKTERLQYELADAKEAAQSRDEVIRLLQGQLARMEAAYTKSLEESVQSRLQLTSHEQEILHLKELCFKYEEEKEIPATDFEELELKIKALEEEKEKMKEEIVTLEKEKWSLEEQLRGLERGGKESGEPRGQWKERLEESKENLALENFENSRKVLEKVACFEETKTGKCEWKKKYLELNEENVELKSKIESFSSKTNFEEIKRKEMEVAWFELRNKNLEMEFHLKKVEREMEEKVENILKKKEEEIQSLTNRFLSEQRSFAAFCERKLLGSNSRNEASRGLAHPTSEGDLPSAAKEEKPEAKRENADIKKEATESKSRIDSLIEHFLDRQSSGQEAGNLEFGAGALEESRASRKRGVERKDELAWSSLYGMKGSGRTEVTVASDHEGTELRSVGKRFAPSNGDEKLCESSLEFLALKKELMYLRNKMSEEKDFRRLLETQIVEMNSDLGEKQNLERQLFALKRKVDRSSVLKLEADLLRHQKELETKSHRYLKECENPGTNCKAKCEILAKERQRCKEIRSKPWKRSRSFDPGNYRPLDLRSCCRVPSKAETISCSGLEPEIKSKLGEELERSIRKHSKDSSSFQPVPT